MNESLKTIGYAETSLIGQSSGGLGTSFGGGATVYRPRAVLPSYRDGVEGE